ncbi:hypothetical protein PN823_004452 [Enterobacter hormaechei]|nr:hypothetical protein [Enterobacter hormaechei]
MKTINPDWVSIYAAFALAWTVLETRFSIERIETNQKHWLNRAMSRVRLWANHQPLSVSVAVRIVACVVLSVMAWIPVLLISAIWPGALVIYVFQNFNED